MRKLLVTCSVLLLLIASIAQADVVVNGNNWPSDPNTWDSTASVNIGNQAYGDATIDGDSDVDSKNFVIGNEAVGDGVVIVTGSGSTWNAGLDLLVGNYGSGELNIADGGVVNVNQYATIARRNDSSGDVYVSGDGSALNIVGGTVVGRDGGQALLSVTNGGAVSSGGSLGIGDGATTSSGTIVVSGSTFTLTGGFNAATVGEASLSITGGGTMTAGGTSNVGRDSTGDGSIEISGSGSALTLTSGHNLYAGNSGTGTIDVSDSGMLSLSGFLAVGYSAGGDGTLLVSDGGTVSTTNNIFFGYNGSGMGQVSNGGELSAVNMVIGRYSGSDGELLISGGGVVNASGYVMVAEAMAATPAPDGAITVTGTGSQFNIVGEFQMGREGTAEMNVLDGGKVNNDYRCMMGGHDIGSGIVTVSGDGSEWTNEGSLYVGLAGSGALYITDGGRVIVGETLNIAQNAGSTGYVNMKTGGMLALLGDADASLEEFLALIGGSGDIQWWDGSDWTPLTTSTPTDYYTLEYFDSGDLSGYTQLTVAVPEPSTMLMLSLLGVTAVLLLRVRFAAGHFPVF